MRAISVRRTNARTSREETETYQVRIPKGVQAGQSIRVTGKGGEGSNGGSAGDIYLRVRFAQHPDWQVRGSDLMGHLELAPWEAVLGATVPVRTLEGSVSVKAPAGFQQGQKLRVRCKGLPAGAAKRGDLYVEASIQVPPHISKEEELLWNSWRPNQASIRERPLDSKPVVCRMPLCFSAGVSSHFKAAVAEVKFFASSPRLVATMTPNFPE